MLSGFGYCAAWLILLLCFAGVTYGSARGLWHKGFVYGLQACPVQSSR
tara:strand:- start:11393 stop:11536 length:144 start_codon:yes stop_codon:yes gene_type:complete